MPSNKKVIVRKIDRDSVNGYVASTDFVVGGKLQLLNTAGHVVSMDLEDIKGVYFVRDFDNSEESNRKTFTTRPRSEGLWVRLRFRDNDVLEAMMPNDLSQVMTDGVLVTPPDTRSNTQRVFVPRSALQELTVIAVIGAGHRRRRDAGQAGLQVPMFDEGAE